MVRHPSILGDALRKILTGLAGKREVYEVSSENALEGLPARRNVLLKDGRVVVFEWEDDANILLEELRRVCVL